MSGPYILLQFGDNPFDNKFEDIEGRAAFTVTEMERTPNLVIKLTREEQWAKQHPNIMGPSCCFLYFGPAKTFGYIAYGSGPTQAMSSSVRQKKDGSSSRYFTAQNGKEYKWKISKEHMECVDSRSNSIAVWELGRREDVFHASLTIKSAGLAIVTELLTSLTLNRMSQILAPST